MVKTSCLDNREKPEGLAIHHCILVSVAPYYDFQKSLLEKFFKHPWAIVAVIAAITVFFALQLPKAHMDNNMTAFLPDDNPARLATKHLEAEYSDEIVIIVGLERPYGTVFDSTFLSRIKDFTEAVENIEMVKNTNSFVSAQYINSNSESIIVTDLVDEDFSGTPEGITELKRRIASWDLYQGLLVSDNLAATEIRIAINAAFDEPGDPEEGALKPFEVGRPDL
ncbi:MAG: hypothetical protein LBB80_03860, partial [Treponema sp.]|nr:hypothetical protein [Treponema sp.]